MAGLSPTLEDGKIAGDGVFSDIRQALDKAGLTVDYLTTKLKEELEATHVRCFKSKDEDIAYSRELTDWPTRQKARQDAHQLLNHYPARRHEVAGKNGGPVEIRIIDEFPEKKEKDGDTL
jgi:hypothetical protein